MGAHTSSRRGGGRPVARRPADLRAALDALRHIVQALRHSGAQAERRTGLSGAQLFVLQQLNESPALSLNALATRTRTHQSSVSTVVTRLVARGLVSRERSAADARRLVLELTPAGRVLVATAPETAQTRLIAALERLPARTLRALAKDLAGLVGALGGDAGPAPLFFESTGEAQAPPRRRGR